MTKRARGQIGGENSEMEIDSDQPGVGDLVSELRSQREHREGKAHWHQVEKFADELRARVDEKITGAEIDAL